MALSDHVTITISKDTVGIARAGFGVPLILSANAAWTERTRQYNDLPGVAADFAIDSPEYLAAKALLSQTPKPTVIMIGRSAAKPTQAYQINVAGVAANTHYPINVVGQGVTATAIDILTTSGDLTGTFLPRVSNTLTSAAHGMTTGDGPYRVSNSGGALPTGLAVDTNYWIIAIDANTFQFASSKANAIALTPVALSTDGTGTQTLRRVENDVICAQIVQALNAVVGKNYTAAQVTGAGETDYVTVTGTAPGAWFSLEITQVQNLSILQTHTDPGITADLDACALESNAWYALITLYNSKAYCLAAAAWVEANNHVYIAGTNESQTVTVAVGSATDLATALKSGSYSRTMCAYHTSPAAMFPAAWFGRCLPLDPGSETWNDKTLVGVNPIKLTSTQRANIVAKNANSYQEVVPGFFKTFRGTCADGEFFDTIRGLDFFVNDASVSIYETIADADKVAFEDAGIARVEGALRAALKRAVTAKIFAEGSTDVQVPQASAVSAADRANRVLNGLKFSARLSGAIQAVNVTGVVTA